MHFWIPFLPETTRLKDKLLFWLFFFLFNHEQGGQGPSWESVYGKMRDKLVAAWGLQEQRFGPVCFTVCGDEELFGQRRLDCALFD